MIWVAFMLGVIGSLHCLGMCGPLALSYGLYGQQNIVNVLVRGLLYNSGRIVMYTILGGLFGVLGQSINWAGFQNYFSIISGFLLIGLFFLSLDLERFLFRYSVYAQAFNQVKRSLNKLYSMTWTGHAFIFGALNGLLPCGLVYLALAGSLTTGHFWTGVSFMLFFGIGTLPLMFFASLSNKLLPRYLLNKSKTIFPILHLLLGLLLVYRGLYLQVPMQLDFWSAIKYPVLCH